MEYNFINTFCQGVTCREFTNVDPDISGLDISVAGNHVGSMLYVSLPDMDNDEEVTVFEDEVTDWLIENE